MDNTWVKLYRKLGDNKVMQDSKACQVFLWLLLHVDKKTGIVTIGRYLIAKELNLNPNTIYKVLSRLEKKYEIVTQSSNNRFTTISLLNWAKYNQYNETVTQDGKNKVKTKEKQSNTIQDIKTIDIKTNTLPDESGKPLKAVSEKQEQYRSLIRYCREVQGIEKEFVNYVKQTTALKRTFMAGYSEVDIRFVIEEMWKDPYWHDNTFDLMNVANQMQKYMNRTVYFKKGGSHASTR
jgi:hypothetical protein